MQMIEDKTTVEERYAIRPAAMADAEQVAALLNACSRALTGLDEHDAAEVLAEWKATGFDLARDTRLVFTASGDLVGYIEVWDTMPPHVSVWTWLRVHPDHWGQGIEDWLMDFGIARTSMAVPQAPADAKVKLGAGTDERNSPYRALFARYGMTHARNFYRMEIALDGDIPEPVFPEGITVRPFDPATEFEALYRALVDGFRDHWGFVERPFDEGFADFRQWPENDPFYEPEGWLVAVDGDEIAGMSLCFAGTAEDAQMAFVAELAVLRPWRRQGLALALLHHTFRMYRARGKQRVALFVDADSLTGATRLYEKAGMHVARNFMRYEKVLRDGRDISTQSLNDAS